jgi:hypothetical protein
MGNSGKNAIRAAFKMRIVEFDAPDFNI